MPRGTAIREPDGLTVVNGFRRLHTDWIQTDPNWYEYCDKWWSLWERWEVLDTLTPSFRLTDPFWWWEEDCVWEEDCPSHDPHIHQPHIFWDGSYRDPTQWWQYACEE